LNDNAEAGRMSKCVCVCVCVEGIDMRQEHSIFFPSLCKFAFSHTGWQSIMCNVSQWDKSLKLVSTQLLYFPLPYFWKN